MNRKDGKQDGLRGERGGVLHTYIKYDPKRFPSPTKPPPDFVSPLMNQMLAYGSMRQLTEEELARAIHIDPSQFSQLGPSIDMIKAMLEEKKRQILERYETRTVVQLATKLVRKKAKNPPPEVSPELHGRIRRAVAETQLWDLERAFYGINNDGSPEAQHVVSLMARLEDKLQIDQLASNYEFTGSESMTVPEALEIKEILEKIDELLKQLEEARENAQIAIIDMDKLGEFASQDQMHSLEEMQRMIENYVREQAEQQGLQKDGGRFQLTPKAYRVFQGKLLSKIFSNLSASRSGRHSGEITGEGAVELQQTKPYEFGDSITNMDIPQTFINAMLRQGSENGPLQLKQSDIEIHRTRNNPKCATVVIMDMSGSMRYDGQYINVKRMALAMEGLIRSEYPGDYLNFIEMYTFAKPRRPGEIIDLMPKNVTIHDPVVRQRVDMAREDVSEHMVHQHFTNIQHSLRLARTMLAAQDTPNRQIVLITDGLPTAHFDDSQLYMLYPPHPLTEEATMREGRMCARDDITINMFLVPSWSQSEEDIRFAYRLCESTQGRVVFTSGGDLDRFVVWDYINRKREIIG
ncbi:MAG: VWA domain-containing protein [Planctomycetota bacterium]